LIGILKFTITNDFIFSKYNKTILGYLFIIKLSILFIVLTAKLKKVSVLIILYKSSVTNTSLNIKVFVLIKLFLNVIYNKNSLQL